VSNYPAFVGEKEKLTLKSIYGILGI